MKKVRMSVDVVISDDETEVVGFNFVAKSSKAQKLLDGLFMDKIAGLAFRESVIVIPNSVSLVENGCNEYRVRIIRTIK